MAVRSSHVVQGTPNWVRKVLARPESNIPIPVNLGRVLVTGAAGSIGTYCRDTLLEHAEDVLVTDIVNDPDYIKLDVRDPVAVKTVFKAHKPEVVLHLAGAKHAPEGEADPFAAMIVNTLGTKYVLDAGRETGAKIVVASTCKACDPETAYGASKLIAERMALNEGQVVVRFYNVVETALNVFSFWQKSLQAGEAVPVTPCVRYFMSAREAVGLTLWATQAKTGRYTLDSVRPVTMNAVARELYPRARRVEIPPRRGDRLKEPRMAKSESAVNVTPEIVCITSPHDPR